jgi:hypothetical protein
MSTMYILSTAPLIHEQHRIPCSTTTYEQITPAVPVLILILIIPAEPAVPTIALHVAASKFSWRRLVVRPHPISANQCRLVVSNPRTNHQPINHPPPPMVVKR